MHEDKSKVADKASEIARNIWLAGVGAYGKAVEEAQGRLEKAMEPPKLFRDLVKVGAALEEDARQGTVAARHSVEERIQRVRENFHNQRPARTEDLVALQRKIDQLTRKVDRLSKALLQHSSATSRAASPRKTKSTSDRSTTARHTGVKQKRATTKAAHGKATQGKRSKPRKNKVAGRK